MATKVPYRAVFVSDVHLGSSASRADAAADFLKHIETPTLYLVGDIVDMWRLRSRWHWPEAHNRFVRRVLKMVKHGTRVFLIPGNHDDAAREYEGLAFGGVEIIREAVHQTADGRRLLVVHGDEADAVVRHSRFLSMVGGVAYEKLVIANHWTNRVRRGLGLRPWSLSAAIKLKVKRACQFVARFEETLANAAADRGLDGVICGHIHKAEARRTTAANSPSVEYYNCGDWVESCTALVEHDDGTLRILDGLAFVEQFAGEHAPEAADSPDSPRALRHRA
ncbi:MAG: UDP-2,3-diacylglucosamine diphosphatase [Phycisphaerales bacterium]